jgi:predicted alpha-1,2-mannosidase
LVLAATAAAQTPYELVHPLTGTGTQNGQQGQTIPGVGPPFAMTMWSPETRATEQKCIMPYYYRDTKISGFRGTHIMSGSCGQEYGSMTVMPVTGAQFEVAPEARASNYSHAQEISAPAYYSVQLPRYQTRVELTATTRAGVMRITFPAGTPATLLFQPMVRLGSGSVEVIPSKQMVVGTNPVYRLYQGIGKTAGFSGYFAAKINHPIVSSGTWCDTTQHPAQLKQTGCGKLGAFATLGNVSGPVEVTIGVSFTSVEEAEKNLDAEIHGRSFEQVKQATEAEWKQSLAQLSIEGGTPEQRTVFYTAFYHSLLGPRPTNDVDGSYNGFAQSGPQKLPTRGAEYYDDFSMWDIYRAQQPLLSILDPIRAQHMVESLILKGEQGGFLPIFPMWNNYTSEMIGDHTPVVMADAYFKGLRKFDAASGYKLALQNALVTPPHDAYVNGQGRRALEDYIRLGYVPLDNPVLDAFHQGEQVSRTLEYAFDDAILADWAAALGHADDAAMLRKRSENWRNVIDPSVGFARGRYADGSWITPFKSTDAHFTAKLPNGQEKKEDYTTESNPYIYTFYVPQNVPGLIQQLGGKQAFIDKLDGLFSRNLYDQGNEPSHHIPYLYNFAGAPAKTEAQVRKSLALYQDGPDGLPGNDDDGQMSAWWVFSAMGLYPVCPGRPVYSIGSPLFTRMSIRHPDGTTFTIEAPNNSDATPYVRSVTLNGKPLHIAQIDHATLMKTGKLVFEMSSSPTSNAFTELPK